MGQSSTRSAVAAIACAVLALTGCSGGSGDGATTPDGSQSAPASEAPASGKASAKVEPAKRQEIAVDEVKEVSKDTVIESPARIPHRLFNETSAEFRFLVLKMPKPVNTTKVV